MRQILMLLVLSIRNNTASAENLKIAVIGPKTGQFSVFISPMFKAAKFTVGIINAEGGLLGHKVVLVEIDNKSSALGAKADF